jgi:hypothetical protein
MHIMLIYDQPCAICIDNISLNFNDEVKDIISTEQKVHRETVILECEHTFHFDCIKEWFIQQLTCPSCRSEVTKDFYNNNILKKNQNIIYDYSLLPINQTKISTFPLPLTLSLSSTSSIDKKNLIIFSRILVSVVYLLTMMMYSLYSYTFIKTNNYIADLQYNQYNQYNNSNNANQSTFTESYNNSMNIFNDSDITNSTVSSTNSDDKYYFINDSGIFVLFLSLVAFGLGNLGPIIIGFTNNFENSMMFNSFSVTLDLTFGIILPLLLTILLNNIIRTNIKSISNFDSKTEIILNCIFTIYIIMLIINHIVINNTKPIIKFIIKKIKS